MSSETVPPDQPFHTVPDSSYLRKFPSDFRERRPIEFHPTRPPGISADVLEIGPGRGDFLLAEASANANRQFVAVELGRRRYLKLVRRLQKRGLANVLLICGDARFVLPSFFSDASCQSVVILFPDPWPKRRHAFNRLLQPAFLVELARILKSGGRLYLKSDVESYVVWVASEIIRMPQFRIVEDHWPWAPVRAEDGKSLSLYAERQTELGYAIHSLCLEKV